MSILLGGERRLMKKKIKLTKYDRNIVYGDPYEVDDFSPQMYSRYSESTIQDFNELRKAMIKHDFTTKDFDRWTTENIMSE